MNISGEVMNASAVLAALEQLGAEESQKAVRLWTTVLGRDTQRTMQDVLPSRFTFRDGTAERFRKAVVFQPPKTTKYREVQAVLKVGGPGFGESATQNFGVILARHEEADERTAAPHTYYDGKGRAFSAGFFLPAEGMRTNTANPPRGMYPSAIGAALRKTPSGVILAKGTKKGTKKNPNGVSYFATPQGIFRRKHSLFTSAFGGRVEVEAVWWFRSHVRTPARLGLESTARAFFDANGVAYGLQAIEETIYRAALANG